MKRRIVFIVFGLVLASLCWGGKKAYAQSFNKVSCGNPFAVPATATKNETPFTFTFDLSNHALDALLTSGECLNFTPLGVPKCIEIAYNLEKTGNWIFDNPITNPAPYSYNPNTRILTFTKIEPNTSGTWDYNLRINKSDTCVTQVVTVTDGAPSCSGTVFSVTDKAGTGPAAVGNAVLHIDATSAKNFTNDVFVSIAGPSREYLHLGNASGWLRTAPGGGLVLSGFSKPKVDNVDISDQIKFEQVYTFAFQYTGDTTGYCEAPVAIGKNVVIPPTTPKGYNSDLCTQVPSGPERNSCYACSYPGFTPGNGAQPFRAPEAIWSSLGCIPTSSGGIVTQLIKIALGLAGTAAILMILAGGFLLSVSQGDTKRVGEAKELITSAVIGLLFIIFSITLLRFIGVTIFQLPGFGT